MKNHTTIMLNRETVAEELYTAYCKAYGGKFNDGKNFQDGKSFQKMKKTKNTLTHGLQ